MLLSSILGLVLYLSMCNAGDPCPPREELRYCTCMRREVGSVGESSTPTPMTETTTENSARRHNTPTDQKIMSLITVVDCNVTRSIIALEEAVAFGLHRKLVDRLTVYNVPPPKEHAMARLPSRWLRNTRVKQIEILDSTLSPDFIWFGNPFEGQEQSLNILTVNRASLYGALTFEINGTVNTKGLDKLPNVEIVDFSRNLLVVITVSAFQKPSLNLSTVILSHNSIQVIEPAAFRMIQQLKTVDISHNLLESLVRGVFAAPARFLESINLSWNFLKALPQDFFTNMPALRKVNFANNFLFSLPDKPWTVVWPQLTFVDVSGNFINCDCNLLWLVSLLQAPQLSTPIPPTVPTTMATTVPNIPDQPVRILNGRCLFHKLPAPLGIQYELRTLTRSQLMCEVK